VVQADTVTRDRGVEFPGGSKGWAKYLSRSLYFPDQYQFSNGDEAAVVVAADIDEEGRVVDAEVVVPFYPAFDRIALDAVRKSTNWIPAFQHNRKERTTIRQPVVFSQPN
jgi:TonB family protein